MRPLYDARIEDLGDGDFLHVECAACGHYEMIPPIGLLQGWRLPPSMRVLDLERRLIRRARTFRRSADVLILSCSCLGYVGGLLNPHGVVIAAPDFPPPRNFHAALPDWLVADEQGNVDATQLAARVAGLLRNG